MVKETLAAVALLLHPGSDKPYNSEVAVFQAIEWTITHDCKSPVFRSCAEDAVALAVTGWEEGPRWCFPCARGDHGRSSSTFQTMGRTPAQTDLYERDMLAATREAYTVMRIGAQQCPSSPLAPYAGGCHEASARKLAKRRQDRIDAIFCQIAPNACNFTGDKAP